MLQLVNQSPFAASVALLADPQGRDTVQAVVKATFTLLPVVEIAEVQLRPEPADTSWGEPGSSSLKYASEIHTGKPGTDVVLLGTAWAPTRQTAVMQVAVSVAERQKQVQVFGPRQWQRAGGAFSRPAPFESLPLVYERAFGGVDPGDGGAGPRAAEERNPVGVGFRRDRRADLAGTSLPNLEDPRHPITHPGDRPPPAGFGFVAGWWLPRRPHAGTYDEAWRRTRAPFLPTDFRPRFLNAACPELTFDRFLRGGEPVTVIGATRGPPLRFPLPAVAPRARIAVANRWERPPLQLETVLIEPDANRLCLTWRAVLVCDKRALTVKNIVIETEGVA